MQARSAIRMLVTVLLGIVCLSQLTACNPIQAKDGSQLQDNNLWTPSTATVVSQKSTAAKQKTYYVKGRAYHVLNSAQHYNKVGMASWYGAKFHGKRTSTNERFDMYAMTAASPELPLPAYVKVTNLENGKHVIVKINDRGPFRKNRILDLSYMAAKKLGFSGKGTAMVRVAAINSLNWLSKPAIT